MKEAASVGSLFAPDQTYGVLFERGRDASELGVQLGAKAIDDRDDRDGNPGGDQSVFNGGSARLILQKRD